MDVREKTASEKRLIDADAFLEKMKRTSRYFDVVFDVEEMPTVDAVEVVRCRECRKWQKKDTTWLCRDFGYCTVCMMGCHADNYCSYGYRKGGAD